MGNMGHQRHLLVVRRANGNISHDTADKSPQFSQFQLRAIKQFGRVGDLRKADLPRDAGVWEKRDFFRTNSNLQRGRSRQEGGGGGGGGGG